MSNVPSLPTAPSQGSPAPLGTTNEGLSSPIPPIGSLEVDGNKAQGAYVVAQGPGVQIQQSGKKLTFSAQFDQAAIPPSVRMVGGVVDATKGSVFYQDLAVGANAITGILASMVDGQTITVELKSAGGGSTVTWETGIFWPAGTVPTQTTPNGIDVYTFVRDARGVYNSTVQNFVAV